MDVYIELVLLDNFAFNFLLLLAVDKILKLKAKKWRLILSDITGTVAAVLLPLVSLPQVAAVLIKILLSVVMLSIFCRYRNVKKFLAVWFTFLAATFLMGGVLIGFFFLFQKDFAITQDLSVVSGVPLSAYIAGIITCVVLIKNLTAYIYRKKERHQNELDVSILLGEKTYCLKGFFDSGNLLIDDVTELPVLVVTSNVLKKAALENTIATADGDNKQFCPHYIKYSTVSGGGKMLILTPDKITVNGNIIQAVLGVPCGRVSMTEYDILLNGNLKFEN